MSPIRYQIIPRDPHAHLFEVRCTVDDPSPDGQRFRLPSWIPGSYLIREFARQFIGVRAEAAGVPVAIEKEAKDTWRAAPADGPLTVIASVHAFDLSVRTAYLDHARGYFNGPSVFLLPEGCDRRTCLLEILPPAQEVFAHWRVATAFARDGAPAHGFGRYRAESYDELIDHPVEMGDFALVSFEAAGVAHEIAITGKHDADLDRLARDLARLCQWQIDFFGGEAPFDRYLFLINAVGEGYGGLEHRSSTSLLCRRDELPTRARTDIDDGYLHFLGLASHEYLHAWNVKRIKPAAFTPYDLSRESYTRQLWAFEGITSYYDDLALVRCGLIDAKRYLEVLGRGITGVLRTPGRFRQSIAEASFDAWIKFYRPEAHSPNATISYYGKGALVALALDLSLREAQRGSLDTVMRTLWERFGKTGVGVPEDGIESIVCEQADDAMRAFFERYVNGTDDPPLETLLAAFGIEWHLRASEGPNDRGGKPAKGPFPQSSIGATLGSDLRLQHVYSGAAAERAGLAPGDVLLALDGVRASMEALATLLARRSPGETIAVHAFRRDELLHVAVELDAALLDTCYLALATKAPQRAVALRNAWLGAA
ncbi:MAG TPA: PDZ domain-containing protein [Casimicrobiaceae bacterium]|nr:PDZ domain-containing protein [Casimicrobiaceae bacterium]